MQDAMQKQIIVKITIFFSSLQLKYFVTRNLLIHIIEDITTKNIFLYIYYT